MSRQAGSTRSPGGILGADQPTSRREGVTVLVTTHFLDEAEYCNDIILINAGRLIARGARRSSRPEHIRTPILEVLAAATSWTRWRRSAREPWALETSVFGTQLHVMVEDEHEGSDTHPGALPSARDRRAGSNGSCLRSKMSFSILLDHGGRARRRRRTGCTWRLKRDSNRSS